MTLRCKRLRPLFDIGPGRPNRDGGMLEGVLCRRGTGCFAVPVPVLVTLGGWLGGPGTGQLSVRDVCRGVADELTTIHPESARSRTIPFYKPTSGEPSHCNGRECSLQQLSRTPFSQNHSTAPILTLVSPDVRSRCKESLIFSINIHSAVCTNAEFGSEYSVSFDTEISLLERHNRTEI